MAINTIEDVKALSNEELHRRLSNPAQRDELNRVIRQDAAKKTAEKVEYETLQNAAAARGVSIEEYKVLVAAETAQAAADEAAKEAAKIAADEAASAETARLAAQEEADKKAAIASEYMATIWKSEDEAAKAIGVTVVRDARGGVVKLVEDYQVTHEDGTPLGRPTHLEARNWPELSLKKREAHIQATRAFNRLKAQKLTFKTQQQQPEQQLPKVLTDAETAEAIKELLSGDTEKSAAAAQRLKDTDPTIVASRIEAEKARIQAQSELVTYKFMQRHMHDFNNNEANRQIIGAYFEENNLEWTLDNLEAAFIALEGQLAPVVQTLRATASVDNPTVPVPQPVAQPAVIPAQPAAAAATATPAASAQPARPALELPVPPRPGVNASIQPGSMPGRRPGITTESTDMKLTKADILKMPKDQLKALVKDPVRRAQLNAVLNS